MDIRKDDLGISKVMKVLLPNLNDKNFKFGGSGITPFYFPALMNMAIFGHFHNTEPRDRTDYNHCFSF
jgi:hypothetical protein